MTRDARMHSCRISIRTLTSSHVHVAKAKRARMHECETNTYTHKIRARSMLIFTDLRRSLMTSSRISSSRRACRRLSLSCRSASARLSARTEI